MKKRRSSGAGPLIPAMAVVCGMALSPLAPADSISGPLTAAQLAGYNSGATYGPQTAVRAHSNAVSGPLTFGSGTTVELFGAPGTANVVSLLFILSMDDSSAGFAGNVVVDFLTPNLTSVNIASSSFFAGGSGASGFPTTPPGPGGIGGIGNGDVNGIKFPSALHAGVLVTLDDVASFLDGVSVGTLGVTSPVNLRVDIFGVDSSGRIINNTPNSGAFGITGGPAPIPEPATLMLFGLGMSILAARKRLTKATA